MMNFVHFNTLLCFVNDRDGGGRLAPALPLNLPYAYDVAVWEILHV